MDKALFEHTIEQLRGKATSDMVAFHALAIIEAFMRGEDPLQAAPKADAQGEAVRGKHMVRARDEAPAEAPAEAPRKRSRK